MVILLYSIQASYGSVHVQMGEAACLFKNMTEPIDVPEYRHFNVLEYICTLWKMFGLLLCNQKNLFLVLLHTLVPIPNCHGGTCIL